MNDASHPLALAFYGDDFTGSTDALEWLARAGVRSVLFLDPPAPEMMARFPGLGAAGVAGLTRSLPPEAMRATLEPAFRALRALNPRHVHYKVCSTFDSSPAIGSIGCALETGAEVFGTPLVPILVGAPALGRHCVFGNLFAIMGIGSAGMIHRLDRHPAMSRHPVTPADESDLRLHLARQTDWRCDLIDIIQLQRPTAEVVTQLQESATHGARAALIDTLHEDDLRSAGAILEALAGRQSPQFIIGSSGVEMALATQWRQEEATGPLPAKETSPADGPVVVLSGSCSPVTAGQIAHALASGFGEVALDPVSLLDPNVADRAVEIAVATARTMLESGQSVVLHTSRGPDDPRQPEVLAHLAGKDLTGAAASAHTGEMLGRALGEIAGRLFATTPLRRLMLAGGDSSSHAARAMGIEAIEMAAVFTAGAPLCRIHAPGHAADGREIVFKGGQVGAADLFSRLESGTFPSNPIKTS
ncbi:MAG: four-carbon acid sugar kinase family protein [Verrucomicrobiota bacterium]